MISKPVIQALMFSAPAICALVCMITLLLDVPFGKKQQERQLRLLLLFICALDALCWTGLVFQVINQALFTCYHTLFLFTLMISQVLIYRFVYIITTVEQYDFFNRLHFAPPAIITVISAVSSLCVPFEVQQSAIYGTSSEYHWFSTLYMATGIVFIIYNTLYPVLGLVRMYHYKRNIVDYSADRQRTSLDWLIIMQVLSLICIPVPLTGVLLNMDVFNNFWSSMQGVLPTFFICPILCYNLLLGNYVIVATNDDKSQPEKYVAINPKRFVRYLQDKKPYLNPKLRITDVAFALNTNRGYVSAFINKEYGMNFSRFINRCRLDELDRLRQLPQSKSSTNIDLVLSAGFSGYRSYLRVKKEEDKERALKVFG